MPRPLAVAELPPESRKRLQELASEVTELGAGEEQAPVTMPTGGWPRMARVLAVMAHHHLSRGESEAARGAAADALLIVDTIEDPMAAAEVSMLLGTALLALTENHRARERFEAAKLVFDEVGERAKSAEARWGLARAMLGLHDPTGRAVLEDAGSIYEDLGDEANAKRIDLELRLVAADFEETPRSFAILPE